MCTKTSREHVSALSHGLRTYDCVEVTGSHHCVYNRQYVLEELCDVFLAAFGPHPGVGVVVEGGGHHVLLNLNTVLFTLITVVMGHVEPAEHNVYMHTDVSDSFSRYFHSTTDLLARTVSKLFVKLVERRSSGEWRWQERGVTCTALHLIAPGAHSPVQPTAVRSQSSTG